jgi:4-amino-4-deoxy-L-arabinose transferase-like glycosyltransferase
MSTRAFAVFIVAFAARVIAIWRLGELPISRTPQLDSLEYLLWGSQIANGSLMWPEYPEHAPGYAIFLGAVLTLSAGSLTAVRVIQAVLASLSCVLTARIAARTLTPRAYIPAGVVQAIYAPFLYLDTALLAEPLFIFLVLVAIDIATRADDSTSRWIWAGVFIGAASVVRPTALVLIIALGIAGLRERKVRHPLLVLLFGAALIVAPVVVQNWRVTGVPLIQAYGGMNFYLGNTVTSDGAARARPGGEWDALEADASRAGTARNAQDRYFVGRTLDEISSAPGAYLRVVVNKLAWLTQNEELRDTHSWYFFREHMPLLQWLPGFGVVLAFAVIGVLRTRDLQQPRWLAWSFVLLSLTVIFLVVGLRYRAPLVPPLIAFAGAGIVLLHDVVRRREWRHLVVALIVVIATFYLSMQRTDPRSRNTAEEWAFTGLSLQKEGNHVAAEEAYRRAISFDARSAIAWDGLGLVLQLRGQTTAAREAFEQAVGINDRYALGWHHLALAHDQAGNTEAAIRAHRRALEIAPERTDAILAAGLTLHRAGRVDDAEPLLLKAAERGEGRAHFALALTAMSRNDVGKARHHAREAARLMPTYAPAQELLRAVHKSVP